MGKHLNEQPLLTACGRVLTFRGIFKVSDRCCKKLGRDGGLGDKGEKQKQKVNGNQMGCCGQNLRRRFFFFFSLPACHI